MLWEFGKIVDEGLGVEVGAGLEGETEEVGVVDFGAAVFVKGLGGFAAVTGGEVEFSTLFRPCPI